jgi:hypothetical protein
MVRGTAAVLALGVAAALPAAARAETLTIRVTSVVVTVKRVDVKPKGTSAGDRLVLEDSLLNAAPQFGKKTGATVGSDSGTMTFTSSHSARFVGRARLPGGTLRLKGPVTAYGRDSIRIPVVGGTGRFSSARGTLTVGPGEKRALNVYELKLTTTIA